MLMLFMALVGLLIGGLINVLADDLPRRVRPSAPHCPRCGHWFGPAHWLAVIRLIRRHLCPDCGLPVRRRAWLVEIVTALAFGFLPIQIAEPRTMLFIAIYVAILILIIVIDLEHRLILHVITFPATTLAFIGSIIVPNAENTLVSAVVGAALGFGLFYLAYWLGQRLFGPGALGFGDVTLSMLLGAMLGFDRIFFALTLAIFLGGAVSLLLILGRRSKLHSYVAYGPFLAVAGIVMLLWGKQFVTWYLAS